MKKLLYYLPFIIASIFYGVIIIFDGFINLNPFVWVALLLLFISGLLMKKYKWWGCIFGIFISIVLIYMGTKETGQIINETPVGIIMGIYYIIFGIISYKKII